MSFQLPDYTSPPLLEALEATPREYQSDAVIDAARQASAQKQCGRDGQYCQIPFPASSTAAAASSSSSSSSSSSTPSTGVILYGGALVDPRSYAPLARTLQYRYGLTVVVPIFAQDMAWDYVSCETGRLQLAQQEFPEIQQWILAGHSFGAIAASLDLWKVVGISSSSSSGGGTTDKGVVVSGMVFMAADARGDLGCGTLNFSQSELPFASLTATQDERLNRTRWEDNRALLPSDTFYLDILGGNHGNYGSYNDTLRMEVLKQGDGVAAIPREIQQDLTAAAIANVAARAGWQPHSMSLTSLSHGSFRTTASLDPASSSWIWTTVVLIVGFFWRGGKQSVQTIGKAVYLGRNQ